MRRWVLLLLLGLGPAQLAAQVAPRYSIDGTDGPPTDEETFYVELINRARADPAAEGVRLRTTTDVDVIAAVTFFKTDLVLFAQEMAALPPAPPLAFNARLLNAARGHSRDQFTNQFQGHTGTNGSTTTTRVTAAGYSFQTVAENVYVTASSVFYGHAGFEIDWGNDVGGMQTGRGHRVNIHNAALREIGAGVVLGTNGGVGPQVITQDLATQLSAPPLLTGVAYCDFSGDNFYTPGEGLGGLSVAVTGANFLALTAASGAFTVPLPGNGTYSVRISGLGIDETSSVTVASARNAKVDLKRTFTTPTLSGPATPTAAQAATYSVASVPGANRYELQSYRRESATPTEPAEDATRVTLATTAGYDVVQTAVRSLGAAAFNLRTLSGGQNQYITLNRTFFGRPGATITFASRLALATPSESAHVQVSTDAGVTWSDVFAQTGSDGPGEATFVNQSRSLAALEGKLFRVRLFYAFNSGSFFTGGGAVGWYLDDLKLPNCEELTAEPVANLGASTSFTYTPATAGNYLLQVACYNFAHRLGASEIRLLTAANSTLPAFTAQPTSQAAATGGSVTLSAAASGSPAFQWLLNGTAVGGATSSTLTLPNLQPGTTGLYTTVGTNSSGSANSGAAIVGLSSAVKLVGSGTEFADIFHAGTGFTYDQILLGAAAASVTADPGQILRMSFIDLNDDIVQVEFSGAGTLSLVLDAPSGPATPQKYNQASTSYMKGHAGIVLSGANATTNLSVFSVGRANAANQALFRSDVTYDGFADLAFIAITSTDGKFGGLRAANASFFAAKGYTGIYAPGVQFTGPVFVSDISASTDATPVLVLGSGTDVRITGGDLLQSNGRSVQVSGITQLKFTAGSNSHGTLFNAQNNRARLEQNGVDVTAQIVVNPTP